MKVFLIIYSCLLKDPAVCKQESLQTSFLNQHECMVSHQFVLPSWQQANPKWHLVKYKCELTSEQAL